MKTRSAQSSTDSGSIDEQVFSQWINKRLAFYQEMEQQVQNGVAGLFQMASDFTIRMEEETNRLLDRYRQQRQEQEAELATLQKELDQLREAMMRERQAHEESLSTTRREVEEQIARKRSEAEDQIKRQRAQAQTKIEQQIAAAKVEREQLLRDAYAERDRVREEIQQLSARMVQLQQALQGLLGAAAPLAGHRAVPAIAPPSDPSVNTPSEHSIADDVAAFLDRHTAPDFEPLSDHEPTPAVPHVTSEVAQAYQNGTAPAVETTPSSAAMTTQITLEDVKTFTLASDVIDRLEQSAGIEAVDLLQYEQATLLIAVHHQPNVSWDQVLKDVLNDAFEMVDSGQGMLRLRSRF